MRLNIIEHFHIEKKNKTKFNVQYKINNSHPLMSGTAVLT
jgi:hypothetical protein